MKKRVAVITGGARGIGFEIARKFIEDNYVVFICSRTMRELKSARKKLGEDCFIFECDVSDSKNIEKFLDYVLKNSKEVDVLVNNAGVAVWKNVSEQKDTEIEEQVRTNLEGLIKTTMKFLPYVRGSIVNIASGAGKHPHAGLSVYCATKYGVRGFTQSLALELRNKINIFSVNPGTTATKMTGFKGLPSEKVAEIVMNLVKGKYKIASGGDVDVWDYV